MRNRKRHIATWVLLAVYLPMLMLASLHVHHTTTTDGECVACVQHHCNGHLTHSSGDTHTCVLCLFLNFTFCTAIIAAFVFRCNVSKIRRTCNGSAPCSALHECARLRGPPHLVK